MTDIPVAPETNGPVAFCLAFYDWDRALQSVWLQSIERLFAEEPCVAGVSRWTVPASELARVRGLLESSGLILSSPSC